MRTGQMSPQSKLGKHSHPAAQQDPLAVSNPQLAARNRARGNFGRRSDRNPKPQQNRRSTEDKWPKRFNIAGTGPGDVTPPSTTTSSPDAEGALRGGGGQGTEGRPGMAGHGRGTGTGIVSGSGTSTYQAGTGIGHNTNKWTSSRRGGGAEGGGNSSKQGDQAILLAEAEGYFHAFATISAVTWRRHVRKQQAKGQGFGVGRMAISTPPGRGEGAQHGRGLLKITIADYNGDAVDLDASPLELHTHQADTISYMEARASEKRRSWMGPCRNWAWGMEQARRWDSGRGVQIGKSEVYRRPGAGMPLVAGAVEGMAPSPAIQAGGVFNQQMRGMGSQRWNKGDAMHSSVGGTSKGSSTGKHDMQHEKMANGRVGIGGRRGQDQVFRNSLHQRTIDSPMASTTTLISEETTARPSTAVRGEGTRFGAPFGRSQDNHNRSSTFFPPQRNNSGDGRQSMGLQSSRDGGSTSASLAMTPSSPMRSRQKQPSSFGTQRNQPWVQGGPTLRSRCSSVESLPGDTAPAALMPVTGQGTVRMDSTHALQGARLHNIDTNDGSRISPSVLPHMWKHSRLQHACNLSLLVVPPWASRVRVSTGSKRAAGDNSASGETAMQAYALPDIDIGARSCDWLDTCLHHAKRSDEESMQASEDLTKLQSAMRLLQPHATNSVNSQFRNPSIVAASAPTKEQAPLMRFARTTMRSITQAMSPAGGGSVSSGVSGKSRVGSSRRDNGDVESGFEAGVWGGAGSEDEGSWNRHRRSSTSALFGSHYTTHKGEDGTLTYQVKEDNSRVHSPAGGQEFRPTDPQMRHTRSLIAVKGHERQSGSDPNLPELGNRRRSEVDGHIKWGRRRGVFGEGSYEGETKVENEEEQRTTISREIMRGGHTKSVIQTTEHCNCGTGRVPDDGEQEWQTLAALARRFVTSYIDFLSEEGLGFCQIQISHFPTVPPISSANEGGMHRSKDVASRVRVRDAVACKRATDMISPCMLPSATGLWRSDTTGGIGSFKEEGKCGREGREDCKEELLGLYCRLGQESNESPTTRALLRLALPLTNTVLVVEVTADVEVQYEQCVDQTQVSGYVERSAPGGTRRVEVKLRVWSVDVGGAESGNMAMQGGKSVELRRAEADGAENKIMAGLPTCRSFLWDLGERAVPGRARTKRWGLGLPEEIHRVLSRLRFSTFAQDFMLGQVETALLSTPPAASTERPSDPAGDLFGAGAYSILWDASEAGYKSRPLVAPAILRVYISVDGCKGEHAQTKQGVIGPTQCTNVPDQQPQGLLRGVLSAPPEMGFIFKDSSDVSALGFLWYVWGNARLYGLKAYPPGTQQRPLLVGTISGRLQGDGKAKRRNDSKDASDAGTVMRGEEKRFAACTFLLTVTPEGFQAENRDKDYTGSRQGQGIHCKGLDERDPQVMAFVMASQSPPPEGGEHSISRSNQEMNYDDRPGLSRRSEDSSPGICWANPTAHARYPLEEVAQLTGILLQGLLREALSQYKKVEGCHIAIPTIGVDSFAPLTSSLSLPKQGTASSFREGNSEDSSPLTRAALLTNTSTLAREVGSPPPIIIPPPCNSVLPLPDSLTPIAPSLCQPLEITAKTLGRLLNLSSSVPLQELDSSLYKLLELGVTMDWERWLDHLIASPNMQTVHVSEQSQDWGRVGKPLGNETASLGSEVEGWSTRCDHVRTLLVQPVLDGEGTLSRWLESSSGAQVTKEGGDRMIGTDQDTTQGGEEDETSGTSDQESLERTPVMLKVELDETTNNITMDLIRSSPCPSSTSPACLEEGEQEAVSRFAHELFCWSLTGLRA
ncbi:unnamed protein product [Choristocarpus tenellus]